MPDPVSTPLPTIAYTDDKYLTGANQLHDPREAWPQSPFLELFTKRHDHDSHFVAYQCRPLEAHPRLNKPILPQVRAEGGDILLTCLVLDYDNPGHAAWQPGELDEFLGKLEDAAVGPPGGIGWPIADQWTLLYTTRGGARIVYVLTEPVPVDKGEAIHKGLVAEMRERGILVDPTCSDWTRLFRLPYVTRDRSPSWLGTDSTEVFQHLDRRLDLPVATSGPTPLIRPLDPTRTTTYGEILPVDEDKPTPDQATALLRGYSSATGRICDTDFVHLAKKKLKGRECWACVFEHGDIGAVGERGTRIMTYTGQAIAMLSMHQSVTPAHIYALFLESVQQLEPAADVADWTDELWTHVTRAWSREKAKMEAEVDDRVKKSTATADIMSGCLRGFQSWCDKARAYGEDLAGGMPFLKRHLLVSVGEACYVMGDDGRYDSQGVTSKQVIAKIRSSPQLSPLITTTQEGEKGREMDRTSQQLLNEYATVVKEVHAVPGLRGAHIDNIDAPHAVLKIPCYSLNEKLTPRFDTEVDEWLHKLRQGDEQSYRDLCRWIGFALAFTDGPICALSLKGAAGAGKKMLVQGLAECLTVPALASAKDLTTDYAYGLLKSPFLVVDEGWPVSKSGQSIADSFRSLVGGGRISVNTKYNAPVELTAPVRVIMTANNMDIVKGLSHKRELSPEDRQAIAVRLLHMDCGDEATCQASAWLRERGGLAFTGKEGRRWIHSDGGIDGDYVVARHFLYLHANRYRYGKVGGRFLVEGNSDPALLYALRTEGGSTPVIIETLLRMLEIKPMKFDGLAVVDGKLYVVPAEVLEFYRRNMLQTHRQTISMNAVQNALRGVVVRDGVEKKALPTREYMGQKDWKELDRDILLQVAQTDGWPCGYLESLTSPTKPLDTTTVIR